MKIAVISSRFPWPLEKGDKLRLFHQLRSLSERAELHLICLVDGPVNRAAHDAIAPYVNTLHLVELSRLRRALRMLWSPLSSRPFQLHWFYQRKAHAEVLQILDQIQPDHIFAQLIRTTEYVKESHAIPRTLDYMDALSAGMARRAANHRSPLRWIFGLEANRLKRYEASVFDYFDGHTIITRADQQAIAHPDRHRIAIVPNGVDTDHFTPSAAEGAFTVSFIGNMAYPPNVDAAVRLIRDIRPHVHVSAQWLIAGASPTSAVRALAGKNVEVTGWVDDIRSAYRSSHLFVAPILLGSGQQNKILEAMACGVPCIVSGQVRSGLGERISSVSGPLSAKGIEHAQVVVAEAPEEFAQRIEELAAAPEWRAVLARNARRHVEEHASWPVESAKLLATFAGDAASNTAHPDKKS